MKNAESRLARLEQKTADGGDVIGWDWANDPYYLGLPAEKQAQMAMIIEKLRPHLPHDPTKAMEGLSLEELEELEKFYIARFGTDELSRVQQG
ncbi:UNVERIFIED_ORG: hypothetical protein GGD59_004570 [Rhizobium esperanzae]